MSKQILPCLAASHAIFYPRSHARRMVSCVAATRVRRVILADSIYGPQSAPATQAYPEASFAAPSAALCQARRYVPGSSPRPCFECYPVGPYIQTLVFTPSSSWLPALKVLWSLNHSSHFFFSAVVDLGGAAAMIPGIPRPASPRPC